MARPKGTGKPPETKYVVKTFTCPPDLWAEVGEHIPKRERSPIIQECLRRAVARKRKAGGDGEKAAG